MFIDIHIYIYIYIYAYTYIYIRRGSCEGLTGLPSKFRSSTMRISGVKII